MKWNAFSLIEPAINKTIKLIFPFEIKLWTKLGVVATLSKFSAMGGGGIRGNIPGSFTNPKGNSGIHKITGEIIGEKGIAYGGIIGGIIALIVFLWIIMNYITSRFTFILLDVLFKERKKFFFRKTWTEQKSNGYSLFLFNIIIGLISTGVLIVAALPFILAISELGINGYFEQLTFFSLLKDLIFTIIIAGVYFLSLSIFNSLFYGFAIPHSYKNKIGVWKSFKFVWPLIGQQKKEATVYILSRILIGISISIISMLAMLFVGIILFISLISNLFLLGALLCVMFPVETAFIIAGITAAILMIVEFIYCMVLFGVPLSTFKTYQLIASYESLRKTSR